MSEWQPARIRITHKDNPDAQNFDADGQVIRVRLLESKESIESRCCEDGRQFEIHPRDAIKIAPHLKGRIVTICEHEILTD